VIGLLLWALTACVGWYVVERIREANR